MKAKIASTDLLLGLQINTFCIAIEDYVSTLGLSASKVAYLISCNPLIQFILTMHPELLKTAHSVTSYKDLLLYGHKNEVLGAIPTLPVFPAILPFVPLANVRSFFVDLVQDCMKSPKFTENIGIKLGIIDLSPEPKPEEGTPNLSVKYATGGHPLLHSTKGIFQGYEVWRDKGDGKGFVHITTSLYADYLDASELPAINISQQWKYKAIYILKGVVIGNWSAEVSIVVLGVV